MIELIAVVGAVILADSPKARQAVKKGVKGTVKVAKRTTKAK